MGPGQQQHTVSHALQNDFTPLKAVGLWKAHGLTAARLEQLGGIVLGFRHVNLLSDRYHEYILPLGRLQASSWAGAGGGPWLAWSGGVEAHGDMLGILNLYWSRLASAAAS